MASVSWPPSAVFISNSGVVLEVLSGVITPVLVRFQQSWITAKQCREALIQLPGQFWTF